MKTFYISVTETLNKIVEVQAESSEEALRKAEDAYDADEFELDHDDYVDVEFEDEEGVEYDIALGCNEDDYVLTSNGNIEIKKSLVDESFRKIGKELLIWFVDEDDPLHTYRVVEVTDDKVIAEFID